MCFGDFKRLLVSSHAPSVQLGVVSKHLELLLSEEEFVCVPAAAAGDVGGAVDSTDIRLQVSAMSTRLVKHCQLAGMLGDIEGALVELFCSGSRVADQLVPRVAVYDSTQYLGRRLPRVQPYLLVRVCPSHHRSIQQSHHHAALISTCHTMLLP